MELLYWAIVTVIEIVFILHAGKWACKKTREVNAALQAGALAIYAIGIAVVAIAILAAAHFISVDSLNMAPLITKK